MYELMNSCASLTFKMCSINKICNYIEIISLMNHLYSNNQPQYKTIEATVESKINRNRFIHPSIGSCLFIYIRFVNGQQNKK